MDNITKFLLKLSIKERTLILEIMQKILNKDFDWLDLIRLKWKDNLFRVRKRKIRIIFSQKNGIINIIDINYWDKIYNK